MRRLLRINVLLAASLVTLVAYWIVASAVIATDPYDLYRWGQPAIYDRDDITDSAKFRVKAIANEKQVEVLVLGSSTAKFYTSAQWRSLYGVKNVALLVYRGVRPRDRALVFNNLLERSSARRFVIWFDHSYSLPANALAGDFPDYSYDDQVFNDLRMVNGRAIRATIRHWRGQPLYPRWREQFAKEVVGDAERYRQFQSTPSRIEIANRVARTPSFAARPRAGLCGPGSALAVGLIDPVTALSRKRRAVDIIIPAYSPLFYYFKGDGSPGLRLADQLEMRRCLVASLARLPGVRIVALDLDEQLTEQFANFADPGHIMTVPALARSLDDIAGNRFDIHAGNVDAYLATLRARVLAAGNALDGTAK